MSKKRSWFWKNATHRLPAWQRRHFAVDYPCTSWLRVALYQRMLAPGLIVQLSQEASTGNLVLTLARPGRYPNDNDCAHVQVALGVPLVTAQAMPPYTFEHLHVRAFVWRKKPWEYDDTGTG